MDDRWREGRPACPTGPPTDDTGQRAAVLCGRTIQWGRQGTLGPSVGSVWRLEVRHGVASVDCRLRVVPVACDPSAGCISVVLALLADSDLGLLMFSLNL